MGDKPDHKASEKYLKPRDTFYEFLERHEVLSQERKKAERKGAVGMVCLLCVLIVLAFATHEKAKYAFISKIFG